MSVADARRIATANRLLIRANPQAVLDLRDYAYYAIWVARVPLPGDVCSPKRTCLTLPPDASAQKSDNPGGQPPMRGPRFLFLLRCAALAAAFVLYAGKVHAQPQL